MSDVYYIKLLNGDQMLAKVIQRNELTLTVEDPMQLTYEEVSSGASLIYLRRYGPFMARLTPVFRMDHVLFMGKALKSAAKYYQLSLRYTETVMDTQFIHGIQDAADYVDQLIEATQSLPPKAEEPVSTSEDTVDHVMAAMKKKTNTLH